MADLFTAVQKAAFEQTQQDIHDTFARPITIFKNSQKIVIFTNPEHNFIFDAGPNQTVTQDVIVSGVFQARILYRPDQPSNMFSASDGGVIGQPQLFQQIPQGDVRLKLDPTGAAFLKEATRVEFDDTVFNIKSDQRPHGLFTPKFYNFYLTRVK